MACALDYLTPMMDSMENDSFGLLGAGDDEDWESGGDCSIS